MGTLRISGDDGADELLDSNGTALLIGMLLDQQVPMSWAFRGPATLDERLEGGLSADTIASMDQEAFVALCAQKPAIHRFPASMGRRIHDMCTVISEQYAGDGANVWSGVDDASELKRRIGALPGFGEEKTRIFIALLAKRMDVAPEGWEAVSAPFSDAVPRSAADVYDDASLAEVREWKQTQRKKGKSKQD
jgi:uncharacterized HhH-GPD family protein